MRIIWRLGEVWIPLGQRVVGLRWGKDRPERIVLSPEEWEEVERRENLGEAYKKKLRQALAPGGVLE